MEKVKQTRRDIVNKLSVLEYVIGNEVFRLYETSAGFDANSEASVAEEGARMLAHVGMMQYRPVITFLPEKQNTAGHIDLNQTESQEVIINIDDDHKGNPVSVPCILAHEICHKILQVKKFKAPTTELNEVYTDLAAIYCGFGKQILNGCIESKTDWKVVNNQFCNVTTNQSIGYLWLEDYAFAYRLMCDFHGIGQTIFKAGLDKEACEEVDSFIIPTINPLEFSKSILSQRQECAKLLRKAYLLDTELTSHKAALKTRLEKLDYERAVINPDGSFSKPITAYSLMLEPSMEQADIRLQSLVALLDGEKDIRKIRRIFCPYCQSAIKVPSGLQTEGYTNFKCFSCGKTFMVSLTEDSAANDKKRQGLFAKLSNKLKR